jgi:uncharacterized membrane protein (DUF373 family)
MDKLTVWFERLAVSALMFLLMLTVVAGTALTAWSLIDDLIHVHELLAEPKALFDIFGLFVAVLVGVELLKVLRHLLKAHEVNTSLVVQTALIALCNKVITVDLHETSWLTLAAVAALILALAGATLALRRKNVGTDQ